ncbi:MAG TPA: hypothetical protein VMC07_02590, partial [Candidatus Omnitrophota bacterium]|nr:hypothetical protein [Candidatus Omnitrophota bacterium]
LDAGTASKIWLNTSLTTAQSIYTKTDLPTLLADQSFSGDTSATITQQISLISGANSGAVNSGKVIFGKEPTSAIDASVGLSMGTTTSQALYNATANFNNAVNFTNTNSQAKVITLFGKQYTVSADSSTTNGLILFQSAQTVTLSQGGTGSSSATVNVDGTNHVVTLLNAGSSSATIDVDGVSGSVNSGSSTKINGVSIALTSVQSSTAGGNTAVVLVGAKKLTFKSGQQVTYGDSNSAILGTTAYLVGNVNALTSLAVAVYAPDNTHDFIAAGGSFTDPVFGSFAITNAGLSSDITDPLRDTISVGNSGSTTSTLTMTDKNAYKATFDFATNATSANNLTTSSGYSIFPYEMANLSVNSYTLTGTGNNNQAVGHLLQMQTIYNDTSTYTGDYVQFYDPIEGQTVKTGTPTSEGSAPLTLDGRQYTVTYSSPAGASSSGWAQIKFPTSDSAATTGFVVYPTILGDNGESVEIYAPLINMSLSAWDGSNSVGTMYFPNGNGYSSVTVATAPGNNSVANWTVTAGSGVTVSSPYLTSGNTTALNTAINISFGQVRYTLAGSTTQNRTNITMWFTGKGLVNEPAILMFEGKDASASNVYNAVLLDMKQNPAGTSSDGVGVNGVYFTATTEYGLGNGAADPTLSRYSNSNVRDYMDSYGTLVYKDTSTSALPVATIKYPAMQAYEQLYLGSTSASVSNGGTAGSIGDVIYKDTEVSSASTKNLIVVGGSCINSAAATLVGGAYCGNDWTTATGVSSGQFLIKSYGSSTLTSSGKIALLVAGYEAADTLNAATYLMNQKPAVDAGNKWIGSSSQSASLQVS